MEVADGVARNKNLMFRYVLILNPIKIVFAFHHFRVDKIKKQSINGAMVSTNIVLSKLQVLLLN